MHATKRSSGSRAVLWDMASSAGLISAVIVIVGMVLLALTAKLELSPYLSGLIPTISAPPNLRGKAQEAMKKVAPAPPPAGARKSQHFGLGDSAETVLKVQGTPTAKVGNTWHYGESRVTFVAGRVTGWTNSRSNPLRIR